MRDIKAIHYIIFFIVMVGILVAAFVLTGCSNANSGECVNDTTPKKTHVWLADTVTEGVWQFGQMSMVSDTTPIKYDTVDVICLIADTLFTTFETKIRGKTIIGHHTFSVQAKAVMFNRSSNYYPMWNDDWYDGVVKNFIGLPDHCVVWGYRITDKNKQFFSL
jgi:hypothetical protein